VNLIEARGDPSVSVSGLGLTGISQVVGEIGVEWFPLSIIWAFFVWGGYVTGNNFVWSCAMLL
jgi:hypothetical protein